VLPRRGFRTKEACGLPQGGEVVAIPSAALGTAGLCYPQASIMRRRPLRPGFCPLDLEVRLNHPQLNCA